MGAIRDVNPHLGHKDDVIPKYLRMVHRICNRYKKLAAALWIDYEDMYSVGCIGLVKAFDSYEPAGDRKAKFLSYAMIYVDGYIKSYAFNNGLIRIPHVTHSLARKIVSLEIEDQDASVIAKRLGCDQSRARLAKKAVKTSYVSMGAKVRTSRDESLTIVDTLSTDEDFTSSEMNEFMGTLSGMEKEIVSRLIMGHNKQMICRDLGRSALTIRNTTRAIGEKLLAYIG
ncbi:sigma-70 family RNA polymerase sigma factor [Paenibacillus chitinolyticus]